jgi:hypothetical protein
LVADAGAACSPARGQEDAPQNLAATRLMVFAHTNRFRAEDPQYFTDTGGRR